MWAAKEHQESLFLFENRQVLFTVPPGYGFSSSKDDQGIFTVMIADKKQRVALQMTFLPDPQGRLAGTARLRKEFLFANFQELVGPSVEQAMQFEELDPKIGEGTYCVFTDAKLVGKTKVPAHEYQHSTAGVKAWPGVAAVFTIFSNGTATKEYQSVMGLLRQGIHEKPAPAK